MLPVGLPVGLGRDTGEPEGESLEPATLFSFAIRSASDEPGEIAFSCGRSMFGEPVSAGDFPSLSCNALMLLDLL